MMRDDPTARYYRENAAEYADRTLPLDLGALRFELTSRLPPSARVLDLGCGAGRDLAAFARERLVAVGLDLCRPLLSVAALTGRPVVTGCIGDLPFAGGTFDAVWCCGSLLHLERSDLPGALAEIRRVLRVDGLVLCSLKQGAGEERTGDGRRFVYYQPDEAKKLFVDAGFGSVRVWSDRGQGAERPWIELLAGSPAP